MNLRVKSIEIVNFLNPLYNRYRSYFVKINVELCERRKRKVEILVKKKESSRMHEFSFPSRISFFD